MVFPQGLLGVERFTVPPWTHLLKDMAQLPWLSLQKWWQVEDMIWVLCWGRTEGKEGKISFLGETRAGLLHRYARFVGSLDLGWGQPAYGRHCSNARSWGQPAIQSKAFSHGLGAASSLVNMLEPLCISRDFCVALAHFAASKSSPGHLVHSSSLAFSLPLMWSYVAGRAISALNTHGAHHKADDSLSGRLSARWESQHQIPASESSR